MPLASTLHTPRTASLQLSNSPRFVSAFVNCSGIYYICGSKRRSCQSKSLSFTIVPSPDRRNSAATGTRHLFFDSSATSCGTMRESVHDERKNEIIHVIFASNSEHVGLQRKMQVATAVHIHTHTLALTDDSDYKTTDRSDNAIRPIKWPSGYAYTLCISYCSLEKRRLIDR